MLSSNKNIDSEMLEETCETIFKLNSDSAVCYWCEAREEGERIMLTYKNMLARKDSELAEKDSELATLQAQVASLQAQIKQQKNE